MADDGVQNEETGASKRPGMAVILGVVVAALIGAAGGVTVVGPMAADRLASEPEVEHEAEASEEHVELTTYRVENLVLNPAGTQGTRFLMATIVAQVAQGEGDGGKGGHGGGEETSELDPEIRDRLMSLLGSKTVPELTDVSQRAALKEEIREELSELMAPHEVHAVFLPTFVIQ